MNYTHIDIHSHLNDERFDADMSEVLARMREVRVASIVVGTDKEMSERAIALAEAHPDLWATIGQHPTDKHNEEFDDTWYEERAKHPRVVAIGECGLDYFRLEDFRAQGKIENMDREVDRQQELFEKQTEIAALEDKPLMLHGRPSAKTMDAYEDMLYILEAQAKKYGKKIRGDVHFFVGNTEIAQRFLDLGFTMSFTGVLTFTRDYDEVVRFLPEGSIMAETDAPYVAPTPHRGKRNEPAFVLETIRHIAKIRGVEEAQMARILTENAKKSFNLA